MSNVGFGTDPLDDLLALIPLCAAIGVALCGGVIIGRRFDRATAVCSLPLLTISGYNVALCALLAFGFIR